MASMPRPRGPLGDDWRVEAGLELLVPGEHNGGEEPGPISEVVLDDTPGEAGSLRDAVRARFGVSLLDDAGRRLADDPSPGVVATLVALALLTVAHRLHLLSEGLGCPRRARRHPGLRAIPLVAAHLIPASPLIMALLAKIEVSMIIMGEQRERPVR